MKVFVSFLFVLSFLLWSHQVYAQNAHLKPGFEKAELIEMLKITGGHYDSAVIAPPEHYKKSYRSPVIGLDNRWELWSGQRGMAVISLRGTTLNPVGWLENFYAAMVPATGQLKLSSTETFSYKLAKDQKAAVHAGWLIGMAYLAKDILPKMDSCIKSGTKEFIITGDSQGGALAFLMTSYLYSQLGSRLPDDLRFKTYCIAGPKPGNTYYAYDFETVTYGGWAYNVVNSADWVPEIPMTVQTTDDFNKTNPFVGLPQALRKQKFFKRVALNYAFGKLDKPTRKAQKRYEKFLGNYIDRIIVKNLPDYQPPSYYKSSNYVRCGHTIVLYADEEYYKQFPDEASKLFKHHLLKPYLSLAERLKN